MEDKKKETQRGGITAPAGFLAAGVPCGIKESGEPDLAIIYSEVPCATAALYTTNLFRAAPLQVTEKHIEDGKLQAVVVNAGNANACTGEKGMRHALCMGSETAKAITAAFPGAPEVKAVDVAVASTGVIGVKMPMDNVAAGIHQAASDLRTEGFEDAARAIVTTDTFLKQVELDGNGYKLGGITKGAGMIKPNMGTMLCFLTTDAEVAPGQLKDSLKKAVDATFNCISVDGCTSTNDMVLVMANGMSGVKPEPGEFQAVLTQACAELAAMIVKDGEGATCFVEINVKGSASDADAHAAALAVADSALFKAALFGGDANWGRIAAALGSCGVAFDPAGVSISIDGTVLLEEGAPAWVKDENATKPVLGKEISVEVGLGSGPGVARVLTCDLTPEYVHINSHYTT